MLKYGFLILIALTTMGAMAQHPFMQSLQPLCGKTFEGKMVFPLDDKDPFKGKRLIMQIALCENKEMRIPFQVGEDKSRTWVLTEDSKGLLLKHDHRHADGSPDSVTMYGGYANTNGNAIQQFFPADAYTAKLIPAAAGNEWNMVLSADRKTFSYILKRDGQLRFRVDFDLTHPVR
jgi:hypothetical protein